MALVRKQISHVGALLVCAQESRQKKESIAVNGGILTVSSAADGSRSLGCTLFVNLEIDINPDMESSRIHPSEVVVVFASPRLLQCSIRAKHIDVEVFVGHAPHNGAKHDGNLRSECWGEFKKRLALCRSHGRTPLIFIDANARFCASVGRCIDPEKRHTQSK